MEMKNADHLISARLLASVFSAQAHSQTLDQNTIVVEHPWARATPAGAKTGAVYMTLINHGSTSDRLLRNNAGSGQSSIAQRQRRQRHIAHA
jgi:copper(I)-binding protein